MEVTKLRVADVDLEVVECGRGRPLLFLHGGGGFEARQPFVVPLSAKRRLIAPSHPGFGKSGMTVEGHADLRGPLDAPTVRGLALSARDVTFERLIALAPPSLIPRDVTLRGPVELHAEAHGAPAAAEITVSLDLGGAAVTLPELHKPAGTPLSAELRGRTGDGGLAIDALGLTVGPLALALRGKVRSATDADLAFDSGEVPLDAILRLFPAVARAVPAGVTLAGAVQASGHVRRSGVETRADARVALRRADVKTRALTLTGAADLSASVRAAAAVTVTADLDARAARVEIPGRLDKAAE